MVVVTGTSFFFVNTRATQRIRKASRASSRARVSARITGSLAPVVAFFLPAPTHATRPSTNGAAPTLTAAENAASSGDQAFRPRVALDARYNFDRADIIFRSTPDSDAAASSNFAATCSAFSRLGQRVQSVQRTYGICATGPIDSS